MELFIHKIEPSGYKPIPQRLQWADILPNVTLPSNKLFILAKDREWSYQQVLAKGNTHIKHNDQNLSNGDIEFLANSGKTLHSVPFTPELVGLPATDIMGGPYPGPDQWVGNYPNSYNRMYWPNGLPTYEQGYALGQRCTVMHKITVAETMENNHYTNQRDPWWHGYYEAKTPRLLERHGPGYLQSHDYLFFNIGPDWHNISESQARDYFRNLSTLPNYDYTQGGLGKINLYTSSGYLAGPDRDTRYIYDIALRSRMYHALNKKFAVYWDQEREWMPNMKNGHIEAEGILYKEGKMPSPPTMTAGMVATGLHFGDGFIAWNAGGKITNRIWSTYFMGLLFNNSFYVKNGETQRRSWQEWPHLSGDMSYNFVNWSCNVDYAAFTAKVWNDTLGQVEGGTTKAAKYKIDDGAWYIPVNTFQDDLCYAKYNKKPIVETVVKNGKEAIFFIDPHSNNVKKNITIEGQTGQIYTFSAVGNMPHLGLANLP